MIQVNDYDNSIMDWRKGRGFVTPTSLDREGERDLMLGKLMLIVSEISEASEAVNFSEELADAFIRLMDITASCGINIERCIIDKMQRNELRPYKHVKACSL